MEARPSLRSIRDGAERYQEEEAGWRMQFFKNADSGLRFAYPESWNPPISEKGTATDGSTYELFRLIPHDQGLGKNPNYILELSVLIWKTGQSLTQDELDSFARKESPPRFQEFEIRNAEKTQVASFPAHKYRLSSMTGEREEIWFSTQGYVYTIGYRSLEDFFMSDYMFLENAIASVQVDPVEMPQIVIPEDDDTSDFLFDDVPSLHPYAPAIEWAKETGVVGGYPDGTFQPDKTVNRAEFLKIALSAADIDTSGSPAPDFPDTNPSAWYAPFISIGKMMGIVQGYPDGYFRPEQTVKVAEALKMALITFNVEMMDIVSEPWYQRYLDYALMNNILFDDEMDHAAGMARKDVVWIVWKLSQT